MCLSKDGRGIPKSVGHVILGAGCKGCGDVGRVY